MVPKSLYIHLDIFYEWQGLLRGDLQIAIFLVGLGPGSWGSICSMMEPTMNSMYIYIYISSIYIYNYIDYSIYIYICNGSF